MKIGVFTVRRTEQCPFEAGRIGLVVDAVKRVSVFDRNAEQVLTY